MSNPPTRLPLDQGLGADAIDALSSVFENTAGSYKFLWTFAILREIETSDRILIPFKKLSKTMLSEAIVPLNRFKLNFGFHDRVETYLKEAADISPLKRGLTESDFNFASSNKKLVDGACSKIHNIVPHRWLRPFFGERQIHNPARREAVVRSAIVQFSKEVYDTDNPAPYKLVGEAIILHPLWHDYFKRNLKIVRCWALWHWTNYLQTNNPNIPAIANKIGFPESRAQWSGEREFWQMVIEKAPNGMHCIYSGKRLNAKNFHLDHYVPWSFVGHNRPWNISPVTEHANEKKGDRLPHDNHFSDFIALHSKALKLWKQHASYRFKSVIEAYCADLQLTSKQLVEPGKLNKALRRTIPPIMEIAKNNFFEPDWRYC